MIDAACRRLMKVATHLDSQSIAHHTGYTGKPSIATRVIGAFCCCSYALFNQSTKAISLGSYNWKTLFPKAQEVLQNLSTTGGTLFDAFMWVSAGQGLSFKYLP